jgi:hypothetical protein
MAKKRLKSVAQQIEAAEKAPSPRPLPSEITYDRVRDLFIKHAAEQREGWLSTNLVIDLMNGWDGKATWQNASYVRARKKLQQHPGWTTHESPTSAQATAMRKQLDKLVEEKLVEKERGHTDGNNSWGYRWITQAMRDERVQLRDIGARGRDLARQLSVALGGDGESGAQAWITPDHTIGIRLNLYEKTAQALLEVLTGALAPGDADFAKLRREHLRSKEP